MFTINSIILTMSDGTRSPKLGGDRDPDIFKEIPADVRIAKVRCLGQTS